MLFGFRLLSRSYAILGLLAFAAAPAIAEDDLAMDMELGFEEAETADVPAPQPAVPALQKKEVPAPELNAAGTAPAKTSAQPAPSKNAPAKTSGKRKTAPQKTAPQVDLLTKVRKGMDFTTEEVEAWIARTPDVNMCLDNGRTMLLYIIANTSNLEALRLLMEFGADVQTHCTPRYEALFIAAINNPSADIIELLINNGANLVEKDHEGNTALMLAAAFNKSARVIDTLLEYGLKVNVKNNFGFDSLMLAAYKNNNILILQSLLDNEADVNSTDAEGHTPLMAAAVRGNDDIMQYLIRRGADFNAKDHNGLSVLDYFNKRSYLKTLEFETSRFASPSEQLAAEFKFIAENHHKYNNALKEGVFSENADAAVADAIKNLADIDTLDANGCTAFLNSALYNKPQSVMEKLINGKANVNAACMNGKNALMFISAAADESHTPALQIEKAKLLIKSGINVNHADTAGNTALMYALANHADVNYILTLLTSGAGINAANNLGETALWTAVRQNLPSNVIKLLIEYGADVNFKDRRGETPLWYLLRTGGDEILIRTLLRGGADTEIPNAAGDIPLWYALNNGASQMVIENIILTQKDLDIANEHGDTPLLYALKNNFPAPLIKLLLKQGVNPQIRDREGNNAYDILKQNRFFDAAVQKRRRERVLNSWE